MVRVSRTGKSPLYRVKPWTQTQWKREVVAELKRLALGSSSTKARDKILRRATAVQMCGNHVKAYRCAECRKPIPNSGIVTSRTKDTERGKPCNSSLCPACNRARAMKRAHVLAASLPSLPTYGSYTYKSLTLTFEYDPSNPDHVSVDGIRQRVIAAKKSAKAAWSFCMGKKDKRGWATSNVEIAGAGNVHVHMLLYCPYVGKSGLEEHLVQLETGVDGVKNGHTWIECLGEDIEDEAVKRAVWETSKYNAKGPSSLSETFYDRQGPGREALDPRLAAAWEVATTDGRFSRLQLSQLYGDIRGNLIDPTSDKPPVDALSMLLVDIDDMEDSQLVAEHFNQDGRELPACPHCGSTERVEVVEWVVSWVEECHQLGYGGLMGSRWEPWKGRRKRRRSVRWSASSGGP